MLSPGARQAVQSSLLAVNERSFTPPALRQETREWLAEHFAPWNDRLERTIDKNLDVWMRAARSPIGDRASGHRGHQRRHRECTPDSRWTNIPQHSSMSPRLPHFLIIGALKAGTSGSTPPTSASSSRCEIHY
jgi:hypothetical protein